MARSYRFFLRNGTAAAGEKFLLAAEDEPEIVFQLVKVLRVKSGDVVTLVAGGKKEENRKLKIENGELGAVFEIVFEVLNVLKNGVELLKKKTVENKNELGFALSLWLCVPNKPEKLEMILQKAVEIGASEIVLFDSDFSQMKHQLRVDRLEKIMVEAAEQSERAIIPQLKLRGNLSEFLKKAVAAELANLRVAMERGENIENAKTVLLDAKSASTKTAGVASVAILIGPEGGFSDDEKTLFDELKLRQFSLGKRILRMETAAVISLGLAALLDCLDS